MIGRAIADGEVHVWIAPIAATEPAAEECGWSLLDANERASADRFRVARVRLEYIAAHSLARIALSQYASVDPAAWRFRRGIHGKPEIAGPAGAEELRFNLSHTERLVACAIGRSEVGIDAENLGRRVNAIDIANQFFAADEARRLRSFDDLERPIRFLELWTLKEALSKGLGAGLGIALDRFGFEMDESSRYPKFPRITAAPQAPEAAQWGCVLLRPLPSHLVAVAMPHLRTIELQWQSIPFR